MFIEGDNEDGLYFTDMADARDTIVDSLERGADGNKWFSEPVRRIPYASTAYSQ